MKIDTIILCNTTTRERYDMTNECIESLRASEIDHRFNIILVESNKQSDFVYPNIDKLLVPKEDFHFNKYFNIALKECTSDWVILANDDLIFHDRWFSVIHSVYSTNPQVKSFSPWSNNWHPKYLNQDTPVHLGYYSAIHMTGWCYVIRRNEVFSIIGEWDENYWFHYQDDDYAMNLLDNKIPHALIRDAKVTHIGQQSHNVLGKQKLSKDTSEVARPYFLKKWKKYVDENEDWDPLVRWNKYIMNPNNLEKQPKQLALIDPTVSDNGKPTVIWEGSQFVYHSLALVNREQCKLLDNEYNLSLVPYEPDTFKPMEPELKKLEALVLKKVPKVDVHIRHQWPFNPNPPNVGKWVVIQPWEFGSLPQDWVPLFKDKVDEMWVPSQYVRDVYIASGVPAEKVYVIPNGIDPKRFNPSIEKYKINNTNFKFLFVGDTIHRKGIDILLNAYIQEFTSKDKVTLVIKDMGSDSFYKGQTMKEKIIAIQDDKSMPNLLYIDAKLTDQEMAGLYPACDVLVHPYRGEGFGLPILESMACGVPTIVSNGGSCLDFCNNKNSIFVDAPKKIYDTTKLGQTQLVSNLWLLEPDINDLKVKMRETFSGSYNLQALGQKASMDALTNWTWEQSSKILKERLNILTNKGDK